ncbi:unnamed protein product [Sphacelaria rigidula]
MEHAGELQLRSLKERVDAERMALKETMSLSRAAAVASVQQEEELCKARESVQAIVLREQQQKQQQQQQQQHRRHQAMQSLCVSPELARGDTGEGVQLEERLLNENQRLAAEVMTLRLRLEEMLTAESRQSIGEEDHRRRVQQPDVVASRPVAMTQHPEGGQVTDRQGSRTSNNSNSIDSDRGKGRATTSPSSCRSERRKLQDALLHDNDSNCSNSDDIKDPEESIHAIASKCGADVVIGCDSDGHRRHPQVVRVTHRTTPGSRESAVEVGVGALVASPSRSSGSVGWGGRSSGGQNNAGVCISSNSTSSSDVVGSERIARLIEEEAEEIFAKLKARPTPELRALIKVRREAELFAAAARVRCGEIERLPPPPLSAAAEPRQSLAAMVAAAAAAAADDQHNPVGGVRLPCWGRFG